jgi:LytS/YehU family sensor histidine kinase
VLLFRQQSLTSLLSPHFVFNALNSIQHYISTFDKRSAMDYLANFARLIRKTMDDASQTIIPLKDEIEHLELYLGLEQLRFGSRLAYEIKIDGDIDQEELFVPGMLIQPYVENAIWHGLMHKPEGGKVTVSVKRMNEKQLSIRIIDNGLGMSNHSTGRKLRGTTIMQQRLDLLGSILEKPVRIEVGAGEHGAGTCVTILIPADIAPFSEDAE